MSQPDAEQILDSSFLEVRAKLLELAAVLDRIDRAGNGSTGRGGAKKNRDPRRGQIDSAIQIVASADADRAARLQMLFSRPYQADWRRTMEV